MFKIIYRFFQSLLSSRRLNSDGYVLKRSGLGKYKLEHRSVAEEILNRRLKPWEVVHHINGRRDDNRPRNLCVMGYFQHARYHQWYDWIYKTYGKYPRRETQLRKLKEAFHGVLLIDFQNSELPRAAGAYFPFHLQGPQKAQFPVKKE